MSEPTPAPEVTSMLWKFHLLTTASTYFPSIVEGAARYRNKQYTPQLLAFVASRPAVLTAIVLHIHDGVAEAVDPVLERMLTINGTAVDSTILAAVDSFFAPPSGA